MMDFPRIQFFVTSFGCLILFYLIVNRKFWFNYTIPLLLIISMMINAAYLINYTFLVAPTVATATSNVQNLGNQISILLINVKMENNKTAPLLDLVHEKKPDIVLTMEVDDWWNAQLAVLQKDYPYSYKKPNKVAYGMSLYSKLPLKKQKLIT